ncbi:MAG TPA: hypothetical protein VM241_00800 [Candidatus Thermoplasmatota archaeon]|nr:hypothetical protein [Candidatus Thermoplasmatota archaeon]
MMPDPARTRKPWRAWDTFAWCLGLAGLSFLGCMLAAVYLKLRQGDITTHQAEVLLGVVRNGTYPLVFVGLGALAWHYVRFYRGDYARR